jgi:ComF family protein
MLQLARSHIGWLVDFVAPVRCAACEAHGAAICNSCAKTFAELEPVTRAARDGAPPVVALGPYAGPLARAVRTIKFGGRRGAAIRLGAQLAGKLAAAADVVVAVPLHPSRIRERGFNQAELVAQALASALSLPLLPHALQRAVNTRAQSTLALDRRRHNMVRAFAPGPQAVLLCDRRVLLVDDVVTTGATLAACVDAFREFGPRDVVGCALALRI